MNRKGFYYDLFFVKIFGGSIGPGRCVGVRRGHVRVRGSGAGLERSESRRSGTCMPLGSPAHPPSPPLPPPPRHPPLGDRWGGGGRPPPAHRGCPDSHTAGRKHHGSNARAHWEGGGATARGHRHRSGIGGSSHHHRQHPPGMSACQTSVANIRGEF